MKTKITWFLIGFVLSWLTSSVISFIRFCPRDYTRSWPETLRENTTLAGLDWMRNAQGRRLGKFRVFTPADPSIASAHIQTVTTDGLPGILIRDDNKDGTLDSIFVVDSAYHQLSLTDKNADGVFDTHDYTTGIADNSVSYSDNNMDGQYDIRGGSGRTLQVAIDSRWYDLIHKDNKKYVDINGKLTQVKAVDGVWRILGEE